MVFVFHLMQTIVFFFLKLFSEYILYTVLFGFYGANVITLNDYVIIAIHIIMHNMLQIRCLYARSTELVHNDYFLDYVRRIPRIGCDGVTCSVIRRAYWFHTYSIIIMVIKVSAVKMLRQFTLQ